MTNLPLAQWVQLNVGLVRDNGSALESARQLFDRVELLTTQWREEGSLDCCFFMRKPPDVRLRFLSKECRSIVQSAVAEAMEILLAQGAISEFFFSDYEPEIDRFGGDTAMSVVHRYFDLDTRNWLALDRLSRLGQRAIVPDLLLPSLCQDLFDRVLAEQTSVLKTWQCLAELTPLSAANVTLPTLDLLPLDLVASSAEIAAEEGRIVTTYLQAHQQLSLEFCELWQADLLTADLYEILATIALFSFNRHGFPGERSAPLVAAVIGQYFENDIEF